MVVVGAVSIVLLAACSAESATPEPSAAQTVAPSSSSPSIVAPSTTPSATPVEPPLSLAALRSARVPKLCDHPAGKLTRGVRKGNGHNGEVRLDEKLTRFGAVIPGRPNGAAAVFHCSQGGIGWPDYVLFYDNAARLVGTVSTGGIGASPGRQLVSQVAFSGSTVQVTVTAVPLKGDNELWGSSIARATYAWNAEKGSVTRRSLIISSPDTLVRRLVDALQRRDRRATAAILPKGTESYLLPSSKVKVVLDRCIGVADDNSWLSQQMALGDRGCLINYDYGENFSTYMAVVRRSGFAWKVVKYLGVAG